MGECFYTGHLLDGAKLTRKDKVMIKTRAGIDYEEDITNAMIELAPELEGETGYPIGSSEPNQAARQGDEHLIQRAGDIARGTKKETLAMDELYGNPWEERGTAMSTVEEEPPMEEEEETVPPELLQAENEAFALQYKARQKVAEVRKLRQYFKKPETMEERKRALQEKMKTSPCHKCGELGHWSRECPMKGHPTNAALSLSRAPAENEWAALTALCGRRDKDPLELAAYMVLTGMVGTRWETLWCHKELSQRVIVDLGCVRSVVGTRWMNEVVHRWRNENRWLQVEAETETFQFGNGETLVSRFRVHFEVCLAGKSAVLSMSVVPGSCPPLDVTTCMLATRDGDRLREPCILITDVGCEELWICTCHERPLSLVGW